MLRSSCQTFLVTSGKGCFLPLLPLSLTALKQTDAAVNRGTLLVYECTLLGAMQWGPQCPASAPVFTAPIHHPQEGNGPMSPKLP